VLDIDPAGTGAREIPHQFFEGWRSLERIPGEDVEKALRLWLEFRRCDLPGVLLSLF
jgi:hypothetical protein